MNHFIATSRTLIIVVLSLIAVTSQAIGQTGIEKRMTVSLPSGEGPFPSVILMHWTNGPGAAERKWAKQLNANGFATITLKSYSRISGSFSSFEKRVPERIAHLQSAVLAVSKMEWSNGRISVLGRSHGAWAVLDALKSGALRSKLYRAVAVSPRCDGPRSASYKFKSRTPLLMVIGTKDRVVDYKACIAFFNGAKRRKNNLLLETYPKGHAVDLDSKAAMKAIIRFLR